MTQSLIEQFNAGRDASVPLMAIQTPDADATIKNLAMNVTEQAVQMVLWNVASGIVAVNRPQGEAIVRALTAKRRNPQTGEDEVDDFTDPLVILRRAKELDEGAILFMHNLDRLWDNPQYCQAIWNLRDVFKANGRTLVNLGVHVRLPAQLANDFVVLNEPLPTEAFFEDLVQKTYDASKQNLEQAARAPNADAKAKAAFREWKDPDETTISRCVDSVIGLPPFSAETALAMSIRRSGMDFPALRERRCTQVEQTKGISIYRGNASFAAIGGCENHKEFYTRIGNGKNRPRVIVFQDELEKQVAGFASDSSGTTQELLQQQLVFMQDHDSTGLLDIGHPGVCKTELAKAAANEMGILMIQLDLGQAKGSLVGESQQNMAMILKVIEAVSQGRALWVGTCNNIKNIPLELRRRYNYGTFFFDLPKPSVRNDIWNIYCKKWDLDPKQKRPADAGWTGAEIKNCALLAYNLSISLEQAAKYINPISVSAKEKILELRRDATGRYISADYEGVYTAPPEDVIEQPEDELVAVAVMKTGRKIVPGDGGSTPKTGKHGAN
jgi:ATPase family associated with various cellular activities (AAA)